MRDTTVLWSNSKGPGFDKRRGIKNQFSKKDTILQLITPDRNRTKQRNRKKHCYDLGQVNCNEKDLP